jgi:hypothetical protein
MYHQVKSPFTFIFLLVCGITAKAQTQVKPIGVLEVMHHVEGKVDHIIKMHLHLEVVQVEEVEMLQMGELLFIGK